MGKEECICGQVAVLKNGRCWFCWQTGEVRISEGYYAGSSAMQIAFYHPSSSGEEIEIARSMFPHLLRGAEDEIILTMTDGTEETVDHFEIAANPILLNVCDDRMRKIVLSLLHINPEWRMSTVEVKHRLSLSSRCKSCQSFNNPDCERCQTRCVATTSLGKRCVNPRKRKRDTCGSHI